jgi:signal recognition particle-docking protein FtsY
MFFWRKKKKPEEELPEELQDAEVGSGDAVSEAYDEETAGDAVSAFEGFKSEASAEATPDESADAEAAYDAEAADNADNAEDAYDAGGDDDAEVADDADNAQDEEEPVKKKGFFKRLFAGMSKTRSSLADGLRSLFGGSRIDDDFYEELEEILIMADLGVTTTEGILEGLRAKVKEQHIKEPAECRQLLMDTIREQMAVPEDAYEFENKPSVILMVGVNGVGKTTTAGKIAGSLKADGKRVLLAAADTFRAAATEQLVEWSHRAGCEIIAAKEGADPAAVVFDAVTAAKARKADVLICDTAGRLHNKKNLMDELGKINRVIDREYPDAHRETFVVLDGTTGQNALVQAREFNEIADITGIVITKLDGTAKGGIAIAIQKELGIPVKYIGVGEKIDDMQKFDPDAFVEALFEPVGEE